MHRAIKRFFYVSLVLTILAGVGLAALPAKSSSISLDRVHIYVYYIYIYDAFQSGSYELLLDINYERHFGMLGTIFINNDNQYSSTSDHFESCETFSGGQTGHDYAYETFDDSYCKSISSGGNEYTIRFRVKKNVLSWQECVLSFGDNEVYGTYFLTAQMYYPKYNGGLQVYMKIVLE